MRIERAAVATRWLRLARDRSSTLKICNPDGLGNVLSGDDSGDSSGDGSIGVGRGGINRSSTDSTVPEAAATLGQILFA